MPWETLTAKVLRSRLEAAGWEIRAYQADPAEEIAATDTIQFSKDGHDGLLQLIRFAESPPTGTAYKIEGNRLLQVVGRHAPKIMDGLLQKAPLATLTGKDIVSALGEAKFQITSQESDHGDDQIQATRGDDVVTVVLRDPVPAHAAALSSPRRWLWLELETEAQASRLLSSLVKPQ